MRPAKFPRATEAGVALACVAAALWTYRGALGAYFSPDDFILLEKARGLLPNPVSAWRFLSGPAYFGLTAALFDTHPLPYHLVNWLLHGLNVALLFAFARARGAGPPAAGLAAGLFGATRLSISAVYPATGVGELLALGLALGALLAVGGGASGPAAGGPRPARLALGVGLFAAALLCKENVLALPLVLLLPELGGEALARRLRRAGPLLVPGVALAAYLALSQVRAGSLGGRAYAMGFGANLFHDFMTYCAWAVDLVHVRPDAAGGLSLSAWSTGIWLVLALGLLARAARRRTALPAVGACWWVLSLLPVLPLLHHTYLYYLYTPLAGLALAAGGALQWLAEPRAVARPEARPPASPPGSGRRKRAGAGAAAPKAAPARRVPREAWVAAAAAVLVLAHAGRSGWLLSARAAERTGELGLPADPYFRKSETARNAMTDMSRALRGRRHLKILLFTPGQAVRRYDATTGRALADSVSGGRNYDLLEECLEGGRALRLAIPGLDSVAFAERWTRAYRDYDLLVYNSDGHVLVLGQGLDAHRAVITGMLRYGYNEAALEHMAAVLDVYPDDADLRFQYAVLLGRLGHEAEGVAQLHEVLRRAPGGPPETGARLLLKRLGK
ncbi:MAG TPA: hypothetical protein VMS93_10610 [Candidatus Saccharimonadales bacterium]|nr:hypothetical protein [Candidatus Saccharimonadales bacterium]